MNFSEHKKVCPAKQNTCKACGKTRHFNKCCKTKVVKSIKLSLVRGGDDGLAQTVMVDLECNNCWRQAVNILADCGAEVCAASAAFTASMDWSINDLEETNEVTNVFYPMSGSLTALAPNVCMQFIISARKHSEFLLHSSFIPPVLV